MSRAMQKDAESIIWGIRHSQGVNWVDSEAEARRQMAEMVAYDTRRQLQARGKVRLLCRYIGAVEEVENPYQAVPADTTGEP
jgi:hypothetical protein